MTEPRRRVDFQVPGGIYRNPARRQPCEACGRPILFFPPTAGRTPLDVESAIEDPSNFAALRLESHFAHCTHPERFRRSSNP